MPEGTKGWAIDLVAGISALPVLLISGGLVYKTPDLLEAESQRVDSIGFLSCTLNVGRKTVCSRPLPVMFMLKIDSKLPPPLFCIFMFASQLALLFSSWGLHEQGIAIAGLQSLILNREHYIQSTELCTMQVDDPPILPHRK